jgi:hypothetical protein
MTHPGRTRENPTGVRRTGKRERDGRVGNNVSIHGLLFPVTALREPGRFHSGSRSYTDAVPMGCAGDRDTGDFATRNTSSTRGTGSSAGAGPEARRRAPGAARVGRR